MAQERSATPEKQLLKLIEDPQEKHGTAVDVQAVKHQRRSLFSLNAWSGRFSFFRSRITVGWACGKGGSFFDVQMVNCALRGACVVLLGIFFANTYFSMININSMPRLKIAFKGGAAIFDDEPAFSSFKKASSAYLEKIRERDIFRMGPRKMTGSKTVAPSDRIIEATGHLKLVGISWSSDPDAMIEDTKALRTFFVKRGQMIGEVKVNAIFKDKVVLSFGQGEIELK